MLFLFNINTKYHNVSVHLMYLSFIFSVLWLRKYSFYIVFFIISTHLIADAVALKAFPFEALYDSFSQIVVVFILFYLSGINKKVTSELKDIIDATEAGTWQWNLVTNETSFNDYWAEMLGYTKKELGPTTIKTWKDLTHPDDFKKATDIIARVLKGEKELYTQDIRMKHKDGHYVWVHDRGKITKRAPDGSPVMMSGTHTDITLRKELVNKDLYYKELLSYIIDHMNSGIAVHDKDMNYIYVSAKYLDQYGINDDIIGKHHYDVFPDLPERWKKAHQRALHGETLSSDKDAFIRKTGHIEWTRWTCRPWHTEQGDIGGIIIYTEIITDQVKTEQQLKDQAESLYIKNEETEATLMAIGDAVISTDHLGIITAFNPVAESLTEYSKQEVLGQHFNDVFTLIDEETKLALPSPVDRVLNDHSIHHIDNSISLITKHGKEKCIEDSAAPIFNKKNELTGVVLVFRDTTEAKHKQKEIEYLSLHDYLTGLYNRRFFAKKLVELDNDSYYPMGLMMIDVNGLKILNDAYGHETGDKALTLVANTLSDLFENTGIVSRVGGDEFTIIIPNTKETQMEKYQSKIKQLFNQKAIRSIPLSVAVGYTLKKSNKSSISDTLRDAEDRMYKLKLIEGASARNHTIKAILSTLTDKYDLERIHSEKVSYYAAQIGQALHLREDEISEIRLSGLFHDIGKISIPDNILYKPARLTKKEYEIIKEHPVNGYKILRAADAYSHFAEHALYHHERYDGTGYPEGLKGENIPLIARIISVADAYEAMTSDRPYRKAMTHKEAINELTEYKGTQFDPKIVDVFVETFNNLK